MGTHTHTSGGLALTGGSFTVDQRLLLPGLVLGAVGIALLLYSLIIRLEKSEE